MTPIKNVRFENETLRAPDGDGHNGLSPLRAVKTAGYESGVRPKMKQSGREAESVTSHEEPGLRQRRVQVQQNKVSMLNSQLHYKFQPKSVHQKLRNPKAA